MSAKAVVEIRDVIHVLVEFRAPKKGELMWSVPADSSPAEALDHVVCGRDEWSAGEAGFGHLARADQPEFETYDDERLRNIVVHVTYVRSEPCPSNVFPHVKLL